MSTAPHVLVYDCELHRPGCVLLQVAMGGTVPRDLFFELFDAADWLVAPTDNLTAYKTTEEQLRIVAAKTKQRER